MSKIIRPEIEDDCNFAGSGFFNGMFVLIIVFFGGALHYIFARLFWWALRLHFLDRSYEELAKYQVVDPVKERLHARLTGLCFFGPIVCAIAFWINHEPVLLVLSIVGIVLFVGLTYTYFLNKKDDPVAYCNDWN